MRAMDSKTGVAKQEGVVSCIFKSGLWRFFPVLLLYSTSLSVFFPIVPPLMTNEFASRAAGRPMDCGMYLPAEAPKECVNAHSTAVAWSSATHFISSSVIAFIASPVVGALSDTYGRRFFLMLGIIIVALPILVVLASLRGMMSIIWFYPINAITGTVSTFSLITTACADLIPVSHRSSSMSFLMAMLSVGFIVGPFMGGYLDPWNATLACLGLLVVVFMMMLIFIPETAPQKCRQLRQELEESLIASAPDVAVITSIEEGGMSAGIPRLKLFAGWKLLMSSGFYARLTLVWILVTIMLYGIPDMVVQYLQLTVGFTRQDNANLLMIDSSISLVLKLFFLPMLISRFGEQRMLAFACMAYAVETLSLAFVKTTAQGIAVVCISSFGGLAVPLLLSLQSVRVPATEVGGLVGALQGATSLASGVGPLAFSALFAAFSRKDTSLPYCPSVPWYVMSALFCVVTIVVLSLGDLSAKPADELEEPLILAESGSGACDALASGSGSIAACNSASTACEAVIISRAGELEGEKKPEVESME